MICVFGGIGPITVPSSGQFFDRYLSTRTSGKDPCSVDALAELAEANPAEKRIVYLAVGTEEVGAFENNSQGRYVTATSIGWQQFPPFLKKAKEEGYQIILINMDSFGDVPDEIEEGLISIKINARFPLDYSSHKAAVDKIIGRLETIKGEKGSTVIVMNAVTEGDYSGITTAASRTKGTYVKSYLQKNPYVRVYKHAAKNSFATHSEEDKIMLNNKNLANFIWRNLD